MGKTILTPKQLKFLQIAAGNNQITKRFYLTGGTAKDFPKMLVPFDKGKMENFFLKLVKSLEGEIFKK